MLSQFSLFSAILIFLGGRCFYGINGEDQKQPEQPKIEEITDIAGRWYAVMATPCSDGGDCNLLTNNKVPCQCISADFLALQTAGFQVYMYAVNNATSKVTVDLGGASYVPPDNKKEVQGFIYSRATMAMSVIQKSPYGISENVHGSKFFYKFKMTIIGSNLEYKYMITTMSTDKVANATVVWCRVQAPGRDTIWTQIVQHFKRLSMDIHKLDFINQLNCVYPTEAQCNEIFFC